MRMTVRFTRRPDGERGLRKCEGGSPTFLRREHERSFIPDSRCIHDPKIDKEVMKTKPALLALLALILPASALNYNGLLTKDAASASPAETSLLTVTDSATNAISGTVALAAATYPFTALLDPGGRASVSIPRTGRPTPAPLLLALQSDPARGFVATVGDGKWLASGIAAPCSFSVTNPAPSAGRNVQLIGAASRLRPLYPSEVGAMTISPGGAVTITGKLSNGKAFSSTSWLTATGFPLFGIVTTNPRSTESAEIVSTSAGTFISTGLAVSSSIPGVVKGSFFAEPWTAPAKNVPVLPVDLTLSPNIAVWALAGPRSLIVGYDMTLSAASRATDNSGVVPPLVALSINKTTGLITGWFDDGGIRRSYTGAIFPSFQRGIGVWNGGAMDIFTY